MVQFSAITRNFSNFDKRFISKQENGTSIDVAVNTNHFSTSVSRKVDGKTSGSLTLRDSANVKGTNYKLSSTVKTGDVHELSVSSQPTSQVGFTVGAVTKNPVINAEGIITDNAGVNASVTFNNNNGGFNSKVDYTHGKDVQVELSGAAVYNKFTFGAKTKFDAQKKDFAAVRNNLELGARGDFTAYSTYLILNDNFNQVKGGVEYDINSTDRVFAESSYKVKGENTVKLSVGVEKTLADSSSYGVRINNDFVVDAAYKTRVNKNLVASVAAQVDTKKAGTSNVALKLDFGF